MRLDFRWNSPARKIYRVAAFFMSLLLLGMGGLALYSKITEPVFSYDSTFKFMVASLGWGIVLLIIAVRGYLLKRDW